jgi:hypothetical protein
VPRLPVLRRALDALFGNSPNIAITIVNAELIGDKAILSRRDFERLVELAGRNEEIDLRIDEDSVLTDGTMRLAEVGKSFDWLAEEEDLYTAADLNVR